MDLTRKMKDLRDYLFFVSEGNVDIQIKTLVSELFLFNQTNQDTYFWLGVVNSLDL